MSEVELKEIKRLVKAAKKGETKPEYVRGLMKKALLRELKQIRSAAGGKTK